ncbi:polysaccharide biosynthesis/export family protein [Verrucomicrobiaceae bacterium R5-34]|uniref:Polysaccharide biosynthesis/export family protein n=1 Tax=Oceaniferula flava TaxID=2800421 RepID=A0AAE2V7M2_9BACT|nr:polysaccharide biosynthesis/export family protein [Oceaniferula flavus]MBK1831611.1 polysaccharide biosynthesis/export family protein [Verrucomicrobiaceae bacterium R5-34]MBK1854052.1 polysaccharide biosynthesis/export family protein [Oceaniferula flavus]MBM1135358.1 polysaccharide biosynthesis/export family protein [Oceaniferula flavus]
MIKLFRKVNLLAIVFAVLSLHTPAFAAKIKSGDAVQLSLRGVPAAEQVKVNGEYRVRESGNIRIPIINQNVMAAGKTPEQVERSIEAALINAGIYTAPTISLQVIEGEKVLVQKVLSVGGQVKKPGRVQFREGMTLAEAIQQAGDRTPFASKFLYLTRRNSEGKLMRHKYNFTDAKVQTLKVYPNDLINVPQRIGLFDRG